MIKSGRFQTKSEQETLKLGVAVARQCDGGEVIGLSGELGAGKTIFAKGMAQGFGIKDIVTSPTFVLRREYSVKKSKVKHFIHIDLYRLQKGKTKDMEFFEDVGEKDSVTVTEWPERINLRKIQGKKYSVSFLMGGGTKRLVRIKKQNC